MALRKRTGLGRGLGLYVWACAALLCTAAQGADPADNLFQAALAGDLPRVEQALANLVPVDAMSEAGKGATPLFAAAMGDHPEVVRALLARGADITARTGNGGTALMIAALRGNVSSMEALAANGADLDAQNKRGTTALMLAAINGYQEVVQSLLDSA